MYDKDYRSAKALPADQFSTTFSLDNHPEILNKVKELMMTASSTIEARLDKLNVYQDGDYFRVHKDTPHGAGMFGSLVVCLPVQHKAGKLVVDHGGIRVTHDWSEGSEKGEIQWAAFYSDCDHQVQHVRGGVRLTLNYLLIAAEPGQGQRQGDGALKKALKEALEDPEFMVDGGKLGFPCRHLYPHNTAKARVNMPGLMKGDDAAVVAAAHALGLETKICRVWRLEISDLYEDPKEYGGSRLPDPGCVATTQRRLDYKFDFLGILVDDFQAKWKEKERFWDEDVNAYELIKKHSPSAHCDPSIRWLGGVANFKDWKAGGTVEVYGNDEASSLEE